MKNKWLLSLVNSFIARAATIFLFFLAVLTGMKDFIFGNIAFLGDKPIISFVILIAISIVLSLIITFLLKDVKKNVEDDFETCDNNEIKRTLLNRIGSSRSLEVYYDDEIDKRHKYSIIKRFDILDYSGSANFKSIRELKGINSSNKITTYIPYSESTEYKLSFNDIKIIAYDVSSGKKLKVECCHANPDEKLYTHSFRIMFDQPLKPNHIFQIAYYIEIPHELECLSVRKEIMSMSLVRIKKKVENMQFYIMLNFNPSSMGYYSYNKKKRCFKTTSNQNDVVRESKISSNELGIRDDILSKFPIDTNKLYYKIGMDVPTPSDSMYVIEYSE